MNCHLPEKEEVNMQMNMSMYDINKQVISQMPCLTIEEFEGKREIFNEYHFSQFANYYMLLCNELRYYTLFHTKMACEGEELDSLSSEIMSCLISFTDDIKSIEITDDKTAIEIWITKDEETYVMYLFNYDLGVIECAK